jgi:protein AbiQ
LLSQQFFEDFPHAQYPEMAAKQDRPYVFVFLEVHDQKWALPLRSHINHQHCFWTNRAAQYGVDYSKAILLLKDSYISNVRTPVIRPDEFKVLRGAEKVIESGFTAYMEKYKTAIKDLENPKNRTLCKFSTLQYFHGMIGAAWSE